MQILVVILVIAWMVWASKDIWRRGFGSGFVLGILLALFGNSGDTKTWGIFMLIGCGALLLFHRLMTK